MINDHYISNSEEETVLLGSEFAKKLQAGDMVSFYGDLGSGKTEFIRGICKQLKVNELVSSPTFTVINQYEGHLKNADVPIYHIDLYRIKSDEELENIGFDECIHTSDGIKLVEWAEKANGDTPSGCYKVTIRNDDDIDNRRSIDITYQN